MVRGFYYWSAFGGVEADCIEDGTHLLCRSNAWQGRCRSHRLLIYYTNRGEPFILLGGHRLYFKDLLFEIREE